MLSKTAISVMASFFAGMIIWQILDADGPQTVHAMTAHGTEKKTMVTVPLDAGMEAVVTLDHVSGDMTGYVLNRVDGQFFIRYRHNVINEFPQHAGSYLMAAGLADFRGFRSNNRVANGVVYVSEEAPAALWHMPSPGIPSSLPTLPAARN